MSMASVGRSVPNYKGHTLSSNVNYIMAACLECVHCVHIHKLFLYDALVMVVDANLLFILAS